MKYLKMSPNKDPKLLSLIQSVRSHASLYDVRKLLYKDEAFKNVIWEGVAFSCGYVSAADAENAWNNLRTSFMTCYRNELIRLARANYNENEVPLPQEQRIDTTNNWNYYSEMSFIAPFRDKNNDPELERLIQLAKPIVLPAKTCKEVLPRMAITTFSASAETQTPSEKILMDIPPLNEEDMSENELCLRSFFDAMYRATRSLPVNLQNKVKRQTLQSVNEAEILADAERRVQRRERSKGILRFEFK